MESSKIMSDKNLARRTRIVLEFESVDISEEISSDLLSFTYTDSDGNKADDLQIKLDDRDGIWLEYLDTPKQATSKENNSGWNIGDEVTVSGTPQYTSHGEFTPGWPVSEHKGKITYLNLGAVYPIHVDHLGWFTEGEVTKTGDHPDTMSSNPGGKGALLHGFIVKENWNDDGKDEVLDCGSFELDTVNFTGPPDAVTLKGTSVPNTSKINSETKTKAWEDITLSGITEEIAGLHGLKVMYLSSFNPKYKRREQIEVSDVVFLRKLALKHGISMKITSRMIVLYDAVEFEAKDTVRKISKISSDVLTYSFSTSLKDVVYKDCKVTYTDPVTGKNKTYTYTPPDSDKEGPTLNVKEKVTSEAEAEALAKKELRRKKEGEFTGNITLIGDVYLVAGVTVDLEDFGFYDGKYIVEQATHKATGGYQTTIQVRQVLNF